MSNCVVSAVLVAPQIPGNKQVISRITVTKGRYPNPPYPLSPRDGQLRGIIVGIDVDIVLGYEYVGIQR